MDLIMAITNLAYNRPVTGNGFVKPFTPSKAVDGNVTALNRWLCNSVSINRPATLAVDLGRPCLISSWVLRHMGSVTGWMSPNYNMADFKLFGSYDNSSWVAIDTVTNNTTSLTNRTLPTPVVYRFVQLSVTRGLNNNNQLASVVDLAINGSGTPYLLGLSLNANGTPLAVSPTFAPTVTSYTTPDVPYATTSVNVVAMAQDPSASIKINGVAVLSGASTPVSLNVGSNPIVVTVTAFDGTTQSYTVTVVRQQGAVLTGLAISSGALSPVFASGTLAYTTPNVGFDTASVTVTPTAPAGATITVNGAAATSGQPAAVNLTVGSNTISTIVTNAGVSQTYTITVVRASDPYLASVTGITGITFVKTTYTYSVSVPSATASIKILPTAEDLTATVKVNGNVVTAGNKATVPLVVGPNTLVIDVLSASGGDSRKYTFTITR